MGMGGSQRRVVGMGLGIVPVSFLVSPPAITPIQDPGVVVGFFTALIGGIKGFSSHAIFAFKEKQVFFHPVNVLQNFVKFHGEPSLSRGWP